MQRSAIVIICRLSVVCDASILWQNNIKLGSFGFQRKIAQQLNLAHNKFDVKIRRDHVDQWDSN